MPTATYRIQLNREFDLNKLKDTLPYLSELGISHIYASPIFKSRQGSPHGYDILDSNQINKEIGGADGFEDLIKEVASFGLEWIQDIVPNHVAYSPETTMISDVMKYGCDSIYHDTLDVDWNHPSFKGKMLAPFLEENYEKSLSKNKVKLSFNDGFQIEFGKYQFPVGMNSYKKILAHSKFLSFLFQEEKNIQASLQLKYQSDRTTKFEIEKILNLYNREFSLLDGLLSEQVYELADWKSAFKKINYRRFFDIIDLICLRMEEKNAFETTHKLILQFLHDDKFAGLRVDHVDGLFDPEAYLNSLRKAAPNAYIVAEKILLKDEELQKTWPIQGTTGYDFLNKLNGLYIENQNENKLNGIYNKFIKSKSSFNEVLRNCKKAVIRKYYKGDMENLTRLLLQALKSKPNGNNYTSHDIKEALIELLSSFPVYRTYLSDKSSERKYLEYALQNAKKTNKTVNKGIEAIEALLNEISSSQHALQFFMRLQQYTGSITAKGLEDTAFYSYFPLLSLNEVGGQPTEFGSSLSDFHAFLTLRQTNWPFSLNATSTHDIKRGEDNRARINVLSEIPDQFSTQISRWSTINKDKKRKSNNKMVPNINEEYYLYQTLIGGFPFDPREIPDFKKRLTLHMTKAVREAKKNSNWINPDLQYEENLTLFINQILDQKEFMKEFVPFQKEIAFCGFLNSLSQTLVKITSPGIPDFYQGTELWDLNFVDPDNRRPVDFQIRQLYLKETQNLIPSHFQELPNSFGDGKIKIFEIAKALKIRKQKKNLFQNGTYIPLKVKGQLERCIIAFCRRAGEDYAVTVCPRFPASVTDMQHPVLGDVWKDTFVCLPKNAPKVWNELFTKRSLFSKGLYNDEGFYVQDLFESFPVALLLSGESS